MVSRFQSVISEEIRKQLEEKTGNPNPDYVVACIGGGSNAAGTYYHFLNEPDVKIIAVEAAGKGVHSGHSAATTQLGKLGIIHAAKTLLMQTDDGQITEPYPRAWTTRASVHCMHICMNPAVVLSWLLLTRKPWQQRMS